MKRTYLALAILFGAATIAQAMDPIDADGDGVLNMDEVKAASPDVSEDMFNEADTDNDGVLSVQELSAAISTGVMPKLGG